MTTIDWRTGASYISLSVIAVTWWITSGIIIHHRSNAYESFTIGPCYITLLLLLSLLLLLLCCYCCYFVATAVTLLLLVTVATAAIILPCYWYFAAHTKSFRCGWIDNSTANTWEYSLASPCERINKFGLNTLPSKTVAIPYTFGLSRPFSGAVAGEAQLYSPSHLGLTSADHYEESERSKN